jgi:hypothetical protein
MLMWSLSELGCYYIKLFLFSYIIRIMILLFFIMTLICHLFVCKCPDYYFLYIISSKRTIISLMTIQLFHLFLSELIFAIIAIIMLLFALFGSRTIISIIFFYDYYSNYLFPHTLYLLLLLSHYYVHYFCLKLSLLLSFTKRIISIICFSVYYFNYDHYLIIYYLYNIFVWLLSQLWHSKSIKCIILFPIHYLRYCNYAIKIIAIIRKSDIIAIIFIWSLLSAKVVYGYRYCPKQQECFHILQRQLSQQKYCEIQVVGAPLFWPARRHPQETGVWHCL